MEITVIGSKANLEELQKKFGDAHHYMLTQDHEEAKNFLGKCEVVFDFLIARNPSGIIVYRDQPPVIFLDATMTSLSHLEVDKVQATFFGFCGLPTFLDREMLEVSMVREANRSTLERVCVKLKTSFQVVADRVGLVTPRVICMIINEAYCTVEEGTATREDIDRAMKLGTNYPWGPFEWGERIGNSNVCDLLDAVFAATKDSRYKICTALKENARITPP